MVLTNHLRWSIITPIFHEPNSMEKTTKIRESFVPSVAFVTIMTLLSACGARQSISDLAKNEQCPSVEPDSDSEPDCSGMIMVDNANGVQLMDFRNDGSNCP